MAARHLFLLLLSILLLGPAQGRASRSSGAGFRPRSFLVAGSRGEKAAVPAMDLLLDDNDPMIVNLNNKMTMRQGIIWAFPLLSTFFSFMYFRHTANLFHTTVAWLADLTDTRLPQNAVEIDLQTQVVTQVINGPVITSISLLFATLVSTTVSTLHNRQIQTYDSFSKQMHEVNQLLALLHHMSVSQGAIMRPTVQSLANGIFRESFREESQSNAIEPLIDTLLFQVHAWMVNPKEASSVVSEAHESLMRIAEARRCHFTTLNTQFPAMHYVALGVLAVCICASFLIATDQALHVLESIPVRLLWSILIGAFSSLAVVCYDLASPFAGAYKVATALKDNALFG
jgi:hypothetical protein